MLIHDKFYCEGNDNYDKFHDIAIKLTKRQCVEFALYCAKDVLYLVVDQHKGYAKRCIDLVEKWLKDENSVTSEELKNAANAANAIWDVVWASAYAAAAAAANAAANAADAVVNAAWAAAVEVVEAYNVYAATRAAANAARAYTNVTRAYAKYNEYLIIANSYLTKTNINCPNYEIEGKILYLIDELDENIIVHKDKYYVNMNEIERCPEYGFNTQQELLEELLYSEDRFWEFTRNWLDNLYKEEQQC